MQELQSHYDVTSEGARRKQASRTDITKIFYKNETNFKFEKYVTNLQGFFNVLEKYGVLLYEDQIVEHLIYHIMSPNTELKTVFNICRSSHSSTFVKSSTYLSKVVARLNPYDNHSSGRFRKSSIYASRRGERGDGRGGSFNVRGRVRGRGGRGGRGRVGHVRGGRGGGSGAHENGIDISDFTGYFEDSEWAALSNDTRKRITEDPEC